MSLFTVIVWSAVVLGGLHMVAPDHWVPLMVVSRRLNYSRWKTCVGGAALGVLHAATSEAVAGAALLVGVLLVKSFLGYLRAASVALLVAVGLYFVANAIREAHRGGDGFSPTSVGSVVAVSAFPDFALVPIMLAGSALPPASIVAVLLAFVAVSALSLSLMVYGAVTGFTQALERLPPRYVDYVMAAVLFATAALLASTSI